MQNKYVCHKCGGEFNQRGNHWKNSDCTPPRLTPTDKERITGLLMGDGHLGETADGYTYFAVSSIREPFIEWLYEQFEKFASRPYKVEREHRETTYKLRTTHIPDLNEFTHWYNGDDKSYPSNTNLSAEALRMWYVSDGGICWSGDETATIQITSKNESHRPEFLQSLFTDLPFEITINGVKVCIPVESVSSFLSTIGGPVPGYEYKWEVQNRETYHALKDDESYVSERRRHCEQFAEKLHLPEHIGDEAYQDLLTVNMNEFGQASTEDVCFVQVCLTANRHDIFVQQMDEYKNLVHESDTASLSKRNSIKEKLK